MIYSTLSNVSVRIQFSHFLSENVADSPFGRVCVCNILAARGGLSGVFDIKSGLNIKYGLKTKPGLKIKAGLNIKPGLNIKNTIHLLVFPVRPGIEFAVYDGRMSSFCACC